MGHLQTRERGTIALPVAVVLAAVIGTACLGRASPMTSPRSAAGADRLIAFDSSPFPVPPDSVIPTTGAPFFDGVDAGRRFHMAPRGGKYYEDTTYADRRSLVVVPPRFDPTRPAAVVVFFHGNAATLGRDVVGRQEVPGQLVASRLNALLVAPQLAVDALDSSAGRFYEPGFLDAYLDEAARRLAEASHDRFDAAFVRDLPIILVAYSGGYLPAAFCLHQPSVARARIWGVILLDALFGEENKFAAWIAETHSRTFFVSAYSSASAGLDSKLGADLANAGVAISSALPVSLVPGDVVLLSAPGAVHNDFVTQAWTRDPLRALLARVQLGRGPAR